MAIWKHFIVLFGGFHDTGIVSASIREYSGRHEELNGL
jgi:hypothetical protein